MRPKCECGKIACYWYAPAIYQEMTCEQWLKSHALCEEHADTENWAEYHYVGFHKKDWQWLRHRGMEDRNIKRNEWVRKRLNEMVSYSYIEETTKVVTNK